MFMRFLALAICTFSLLCIQDAHAATDPGGFLGLKWAQSPAECQNLGLCSAETVSTDDQINGETVFKGTAENLDGVPLRFSTFSFKNNKYFLGVASFDSAGDTFGTLKKALISQHGKPRVESARMASWTVGKTKIQLTDGKKVGGLVYTHVPTFTEVAKAKKYPLPMTPPKK